MTVLSSGATKFYKYALPGLWFGFVLLILVVSLAAATPAQRLAALSAPCVMAVVGYLICRRSVWSLADLVEDAGSHLLVRRGSLEEQIPLANVMNVSPSIATNPARITLRLVNGGVFGPEIVFIPVRRLTLNPLARNPIAEDLMVRAYAARAPRPT